jgi:hypothetical protein
MLDKRLTRASVFKEIFNAEHRVVSQRGSSSSKFTFTAHDSGEHRICFTPSSNSGRSGWLSTASPNGGIRLTLDLAIGDSTSIDNGDKDKMEDIAARVKDLNARLSDIRREQVFQRVSRYLVTSRWAVQYSSSPSACPARICSYLQSD